MNAYGTGVGLKDAIIGHYHAGWDHFICMNDTKNLIVSNTKTKLRHTTVVII